MSRRYRDDYIDTLHVFRREKYKARFAQESKVDLVDKVMFDIKYAEMYGMTGSKVQPTTDIATKTDPRRQLRFTPEKRGIMTANGFIRTPTNQRYDVI